MSDESDPSDDVFTDEGPSKSLRKRQSQELQDLGEALIALPQSELDALPLPDALRDAVLLARRITKHGGLYRQKQFIGKLMRKIDAEPIRAALHARQERQRVAARQFHSIERWRMRLIDEPQALDEFLAAHPDAERAPIAQSIADARRERDAHLPPKAARNLFRAIQRIVMGEE